MGAAKNAIESFSDVVQDLLVPKLKAVKVSVESLHKEIGYLRTEMKLRNEKHHQALRHLSEKLDFTIDIRERLASIEARIPRQ